MPNYKITYFFEGVQDADQYANANVGWTETWYLQHDSLEQALLYAIDPKNYITPRTSFMPTMYRCVWVRASDDANPRASKVAAILGGRGQVSVATSDPIQVTCAVLVDFMRLPTAPGEQSHHRRFLIRGLPHILVNGNILAGIGSSVGGPNVELVPPFNASGSAALLARLRNFLNIVGSHEVGVAPVPSPLLRRWFMKYHDPAVTKKQLISLIVQPNNRQVQISLNGVATLPEGSKVSLHRVNLPRGMNRTWTVIQNQGGTPPLILVGTSRIDEEGTWDGTGYGVPVAWQYNAVDQYTIIGMRTKSTGRPFKLTRGRRRVGSSLE